ncbi:MAG: penicillin-binding protein 2, partial [Anaerolineae bacterium]
AATVTALAAELDSEWAGPDTAEIRYAVDMSTLGLGDFRVTGSMPLVWEEGWRINWSPELIFPDLSENQVFLQRRIPARASIYARDGRPLAIDQPQVEVGVIPGEISDERALLEVLSELLDLEPEAISDRYRAPQVQPDWRIAVGELPFEEFLEHREGLEKVPGTYTAEITARAYPQGDSGSHLVGYLGAMDPSEVDAFLERGYRSGDLVGRAGLEEWGEPYLSGGIGATLGIIAPSGEWVRVLREQPSSASRSLHTALDLDLQKVAEEALGERTGAVVALDPWTGELLAAASYPRFDPNRIGPNSDPGYWEKLTRDGAAPLLNRALQGAYPSGSVFKVVTTAAALDGAGLSPSTVLTCPGYWEGPNLFKSDWKAHGSVGFFQAIAQSCDVFFYDLGLRMDQMDPWLLPRTASAFGFGAPTGIEGADESPGLVPDPAWKQTGFTGAGNPFWVPGDAVNLAIGQGDLLTTPLQVANMMAAVANGGTLLRPRLVLHAAAAPGTEETLYSSEIAGRLPLTQISLDLIRQGLWGTANDPLGTAAWPFRDMEFSVAGKTGTAEAPPGETHAWFAGYAPYEDPVIAVAVVVEHGGEGWEVAAPIFRRVVETYILGYASIEVGATG